ncbi:hypothetical protein [Pseudomonas sp. H3(2019)]|uniref:hypothetical protein n=1 Tax=Pseudomonas sp. H3(2019) TaxID=2598724 RepID=UPI001194FDBD|nr:hypothetical protein [Pseudomonas sp. H3(2019)]TVT79775.1 hypothetical protein FPT12_25460 [Pseudomonas sp. H3(2019)]
MSSKPTNDEIAKLAKITADEVGAYKCHEEHRSDGSWLIVFGVEIPPYLRGELSRDCHKFCVRA